MHRASSCRWLTKALRTGESLGVSGVPLILRPTAGITRRLGAPPVSLFCDDFHKRRWNHSEAVEPQVAELVQPEIEAAQPEDGQPIVESVAGPKRKLPATCSGCGAFAQTSAPDQLGYFDLNASRVRKWLSPKKRQLQEKDMQENQVVNDVLGSMDSEQLAALGLDPSKLMATQDAAEAVSNEEKAPVCNRCHDLIHHNVSSASAKIPIFHPTVEILRETIEESTHKYNHIYHVIDAADFPLSLIPRLNVLLGDVPLRSRNRRSRTDKFKHDRITEMSFIITRSDLLGPTKETVDALMPYLREVLRDSLGRVGDKVRLGNIHLVSVLRGWWTIPLKEDIWKRGGAGWMVGKVNVGKSRLFESIYPKGRMEVPKNADGTMAISEPLPEDDEELKMGELLPPLQKAMNYPELPVVSSLPGTTASPIRLPFGNKRGELIDLPGMARSDLELFVQEKHRQSLVMTKRVVPEQASVKSGQSLLLGGGLIRISARNENLVFLMYNFTPLEQHVTSLDKAKEIQENTRALSIQENICLPDTAAKIQHAGTFSLQYDVTKNRAGPLTQKQCVGLSVDRLPFRVMSVDILIEGVGFVEVVAQIRQKWPKQKAAKGSDRQRVKENVVPAQEKQAPADPFERMMLNRRDGTSCMPFAKPEKSREQIDREAATAYDFVSDDEFPSVDVYTPEGRFVATRRPIEGWLNNKPKVLDKHKRCRPRKSMKGVKKTAKAEARRKASTGATE